MFIARFIGSRPGKRRALVGAAAVVGAVGLGLPAMAIQGSASTPTQAMPWLDAGKPMTDRVNALLRAMTLPEKVGQMDQQLVDNVTTDVGNTNCGGSGFSMPNTACMKSVLIDTFTGSVLAGGTDNPPDTTGAGGVGNTGLDWANEYNTIQRFAIENSRLHIPVIF